MLTAKLMTCHVVASSDLATFIAETYNCSMEILGNNDTEQLIQISESATLDAYTVNDVNATLESGTAEVYDLYNLLLCLVKSEFIPAGNYLIRFRW
jgi:hypothetical protein